MLSTISNVSFITWLQHKHTCWQQESVSSRDGSVSIFTARRYALRGRRNSVCHTRGLCPVSSVDMVRPTIMISSPYGINPNPLVYFDLWLCGEKLLLTLLVLVGWWTGSYQLIYPFLLQYVCRMRSWTSWQMTLARHRLVDCSKCWSLAGRRRTSWNPVWTSFLAALGRVLSGHNK